jgi:predicted signal transduction protein with EAL and GGDEF domain
VVAVVEALMADDGKPFPGEVIEDHKHFAALLKWPSTNFGAGYSGPNLLAEFERDQIRIDINLVRGIERNAPRQTVVRAINQACEDLGINVIAEGVETLEEYRW